MTQPSHSERRGNRSTIHYMTLHLNDIHDLFASPRTNPYQDDYFPLSGIDQIARQMKLARPRSDLHVTFVLPPSSGQKADLESEIKSALKRYVDIRLPNLELELKARQISVLRSLQIGVIILGISLALAAAISNGEFLAPWLRTLLSNSISIFGSVALWSPADAFLFGMRPMYNDLHIYRAIRDMSFDIQYEQSVSAPMVASQAS